MSGPFKINIDVDAIKKKLPSILQTLQSEPAFFFYYAAIGTCEYTVTKIGPMAQTKYNQLYYPDTMYIQSTWGSHYFYVNWGY
jgi:hypothetical protein